VIIRIAACNDIGALSTAGAPGSRRCRIRYFSGRMLGDGGLQSIPISGIVRATPARGWRSSRLPAKRAHAVTIRTPRRRGRAGAHRASTRSNWAGRGFCGNRSKFRASSRRAGQGAHSLRPRHNRCPAARRTAAHARRGSRPPTGSPFRKRRAAGIIKAGDLPLRDCAHERPWAQLEADVAHSSDVGATRAKWRNAARPSAQTQRDRATHPWACGCATALHARPGRRLLAAGGHRRSPCEGIDSRSTARRPTRAASLAVMALGVRHGDESRSLQGRADGRFTRSSNSTPLSKQRSTWSRPPGTPLAEIGPPR